MKRGMPPIPSNRRNWIRQVTVGGILAAGLPPSLADNSTRPVRFFHVCLSPAIVEREEGLLPVVRNAGVGTVWLADFFYGHRPFPADQVRRARARIEAAGMEAQLINVPLGHPGDSLDARDGGFPLTPPGHWRTARRPDGREYVGTSLHAPATAENAAAVREQRRLGFRTCFLDDDFRLARGPGEIGGCFCPEHRERFLRREGWAAARWDELLDDVRARRLTGLVRAWLDFQGDELTGSFRTQQRAFGGQLGIMAMYLGAEKAGIRLADYRRVPFRVGELMFDDRSFGSVKGKTDELFSALFHRRFAEPERAYSETTAFPADRLSARNLAAKLAVSTLADVRHTMFMSGLTPFAREHWAVLGPAMRDQGRFHAVVAGHRPRGPFKHFWGEAERSVGEDRPFSLWLALGIPFEVVDEPAVEGWTFLTDFDAALWAGRTERSKRGQRVCRASAASRPEGAELVTESLPELFAFRRRILPSLEGIPHVLEEVPAVCAWYPTAGRVLVWNLAEEGRTLTVRHGKDTARVPLGGLGMALVEVRRTGR